MHGAALAAAELPARSKATRRPAPTPAADRPVNRVTAPRAAGGSSSARRRRERLRERTPRRRPSSTAKALEALLGHQVERLLERHVGPDRRRRRRRQTRRPSPPQVDAPRDRGHDARPRSPADEASPSATSTLSTFGLREQLGRLAGARAASRTRGSEMSASRTITDRSRAPRAPRPPRGCCVTSAARRSGRPSPRRASRPGRARRP